MLIKLARGLGWERGLILGKGLGGGGRGRDMGGGEGIGLSELSYICNALNVRTLFPTLFKAGQLKTGIDFWGISTE